MPTTSSLALILFCGLSISTSGQIQRTSVPIDNAAAKALEVGALTAKGLKPFHIRMVVSEPENPESPYQGTIEEWWSSPEQWRRVVTSKDGMHQIIVMAQGKKTESDQGDYFPLWLRNFVTALFDPIPDAAAWTASGMTIDQITMPNGAKSDACARAEFKIGSVTRQRTLMPISASTAMGALSSMGAHATPWSSMTMDALVKSKSLESWSMIQNRELPW